MTFLRQPNASRISVTLHSINDFMYVLLLFDDGVSVIQT